MSESIYLIVIPAVLLTALMCIERPTIWRCSSFGLLIAMAALLRSEAVDLIVRLGVPIILIAAGDRRKRLQTGLAFTVGFLLLLMPWLIRNQVQLGSPSLSNNSGVRLDGYYCPAALNPSDPAYGGFNFTCAFNTAAFVIRDTKPPSPIPK
jgi:hypothetical protein